MPFATSLPFSSKKREISRLSAWYQRAVSVIDGQRLLLATNGDLAIDQEVIRGWRLYDVHPHEERPSLRFELTDDADRMVEIEVHRAGEHLTVEWRKTSADREAASAARAVIEGALEGVPAEISRVAGEEGAVDHARVLVRDAAPWSDPLLMKDFRGYQLLHGPRPRRVRVSANQWEAPGDSVWYPAPVRGTLAYAAALYPLPRRFCARRRFREYLAKLGFALDAEGCARTVPLPETFRLGAIALTGHSPAWSPRLEPLDIFRRKPQAWAERVVRGVLPASVPPIALVGLLSLLPARSPVQPPFAPGMLAHDMSLHAFALHRVRFEALEPLVDVSSLRRASFRTRRRRWDRLAEWFEGTVTREAWKVWQQVNRPEDFNASFAAQLPSLARSFADEVLASS